MYFRHIVLAVAVSLFADHAAGHGRVLDPPNRSSMWRYGFPTEPNYTDMGINCGGFDTQYNMNGGKCGICGDNFADRTPRDNEDGGLYGRGVVAKSYTAGGKMPVFVELTQEHKGHFEFGLCDLSKGKESDSCFKPIYLVGGGNYQVPLPGDGKFINHTMTLQLPGDVRCDRCVVRWHYQTANSQGICSDGSEALGCGNQEVFRNCIDIAIH